MQDEAHLSPIEVCNGVFIHPGLLGGLLVWLAPGSHVARVVVMAV